MGDDPRTPEAGKHLQATQEKRQSPRVNLHWPVVMMTVAGPVEGVSENISLKGVMVRCDSIPELEETFRLVIKAPAKVPLLATAQPVWQKSALGGNSLAHGVGIHFQYLVEEDLDYLAAVLRRRLADVDSDAI